MLPDGAEKQLEDWTIFFLNQTPFNRIAPVLALESHLESSSGPTGNEGEDGKKEIHETQIRQVSVLEVYVSLR